MLNHRFSLHISLSSPLSPWTLTKAELLPLIEKVADKLPGRKAALMNKACRLTLVRAVLTAIPICSLIALELPTWVIKAIDKRQRAFLWKGREHANGGNCLVTWPKVCKPLEFGGLGIHDLTTLGWALCMQWLWLTKTQPCLPWTDYDVLVHNNIKALFMVSVHMTIGDGHDTLFWSDRWLQ